MKRIVCLMLSLVLILSMTGCHFNDEGNTNPMEPNNSQNNTQPQPNESVTTTPTDGTETTAPTESEDDDGGGIKNEFFWIDLDPQQNYLERSRMQRDESAIGEIANAVMLAPHSNEEIYNEVAEFCLDNNVSCYIDNESEAYYADHRINIEGGYIFNDECRKERKVNYYVAGDMVGVTITLHPTQIEDGYGYILADGIVNEFMGGDKKFTDLTKLYEYVVNLLGDNITLASLSYKNADCTIFIELNGEAPEYTIQTHAQFNGERLPAPATETKHAN